MFGVSVSQTSGSYFPLFLVSAPSGYGWFSGLCRLPVEGTGACVLVDEAGFCLSVGQDHVRWCVLGCL